MLITSLPDPHHIGNKNLEAGGFMCAYRYAVGGIFYSHFARLGRQLLIDEISARVRPADNTNALAKGATSQVVLASGEWLGKC